MPTAGRSARRWAPAPSNGTLKLNANGSFSYTPTAGFYGTDSFTYTAADAHAVSAPATVTITVNPVPIANPDSYTTPENTTLTATSVLANDTDTNPAIPLTSAQLSRPKNGTLTFNSDGTFSYVPATNFVGADTFSYSAERWDALLRARHGDHHRHPRGYPAHRLRRHADRRPQYRDERLPHLAQSGWPDRL